MLLKQIFALSALFVSFAAASPMPHPLNARAIAEDDFLIKKSEESAALEKRYQCKAKRQAIMEKREKFCQEYYDGPDCIPILPAC
ncbi:MAG: hypothetical protein MMC33_009814 [Icmadophila ericetorum]|nr:hypothetical protein [Icmadophila ericetorum]